MEEHGEKKKKKNKWEGQGLFKVLHIRPHIMTNESVTVVAFVKYQYGIMMTTMKQILNWDV